MVIGAFPAAKLGALLLKQISKPIANVVKENAKSSPVFRKYVCVPPAHFYNWCEIKLKMWILNLGKPVNIPVLNEAMAIELGSNILGEAVIFIIGAGILLSEYNRSSRKEAAKEAAKKYEMSEIQRSLRELFLRSEENSAHIRELSRQLAGLDSRLGIKEDLQKPSPPEPSPPETSPPKASPPESSPPEASPSNSPTSDFQSHEPSQPTPCNSPQNNNIAQNPIRRLSLTTHGGRNTSFGQYSLVLRAVNDVEEQFWDYPLVEREDSLLLVGLFYVNKLFRFQQ